MLWSFSVYALENWKKSSDNTVMELFKNYTRLRLGTTQYLKSHPIARNHIFIIIF